MLFMILPALAFAGSIVEKDSVKSRELDEVVVNGRSQRIIKFGVEYIPDKKTKKISTDATDLLFHLMIPKLRVIPGKQILKL